MRFSRAELRRHVLAAGIVAEISGVTIWRWLREDAIHPWAHRSWIYFSILQRKALTPSDFPTVAAAAARILGFQHHYQTVARPFEWRFTRRDLARLLARCSPSSPARIAA